MKDNRICGNCDFFCEEVTIKGKQVVSWCEYHRVTTAWNDKGCDALLFFFPLYDEA